MTKKTQVFNLLNKKLERLEQEFMAAKLIRETEERRNRRGKLAYSINVLKEIIKQIEEEL